MLIVVHWGRSWNNFSARNGCTFDQTGQVVVALKSYELLSCTTSAMLDGTL